MGISVELPSKVAGHPGAPGSKGYIRIQNYTDDGSEFKDSDYYLEIVAQTSPNFFVEFKKQCLGAPAPLRKLKTGFWCKIGDVQGASGDGNPSHMAFVPTPGGIQAIYVFGRLAETIVKSVALTAKGQD